MPVKAYNPTTPARRGMTSQDLSDITTKKPLKSLIKAKKQNAGRNNQGRITTRHRGGGGPDGLAAPRHSRHGFVARQQGADAVNRKRSARLY